MQDPFLYLTGFEPFLNVKVNPSGEIAKRLNGVSLDGVEIVSTVLPVTFAGMPSAFDEGLAGRTPLLYCSLGVQRDGYYRLELRARPRLDSIKPDESGAYGEELEPLGEHEKRTTADMDRLLSALRAGGALEARTSDDAGGYVCERCFWQVLQHAEEEARIGVFLHVPGLEHVSVEQQLKAVTSMLRDMIVQARSLLGQ